MAASIISAYFSGDAMGMLQLLGVVDSGRRGERGERDTLGLILSARPDPPQGPGPDGDAGLGTTPPLA
ncbi:hypothetical protein MICRO116_900009 [Micrococcus sp. 116]|nr:hypothetical protein MICRO116_900009 [Micrococcus sp. 116]